MCDDGRVIIASSVTGQTIAAIDPCAYMKGIMRDTFRWFDCMHVWGGHCNSRHLTNSPQVLVLGSIMPHMSRPWQRRSICTSCTLSSSTAVVPTAATTTASQEMYTVKVFPLPWTLLLASNRSPLRGFSPYWCYQLLRCFCISRCVDGAKGAGETDIS